MQTSRTILQHGERRGEKWEARLSSAWTALSKGDGSAEDFELAFTDLAEQSEYFFIAAPGAEADELLRREGKRELFARILYLLDRPGSFMTELRRAALDEMTVSNIEGE